MADTQQKQQTKKNKKDKKNKQNKQRLTPEEIEAFKAVAAIKAAIKEKDKPIQPYLNKIKISMKDNETFCVQRTIDNALVSDLHTNMVAIVAKGKTDDYNGLDKLVLCLLSFVEPIYEEEKKKATKKDTKGEETKGEETKEDTKEGEDIKKEGEDVKKEDTTKGEDETYIAVSIYIPTSVDFKFDGIVGKLLPGNESKLFDASDTVQTFRIESANPFKESDVVQNNIFQILKDNNVYQDDDDDSDVDMESMMEEAGL
jgi:hypothetical protein